jgi:CheY-like chemotaxis protein
LAGTPSILFVDDEPHLLEGIARTFRNRYPIQTAGSGPEGLLLLNTGGPFAVVVSDMRMPQMNGAEFLAKVREQSPDSVRIILSGHADLAQTIAAVNEGNIFRFLSKPCSADTLTTALTTALEQYRLVTAEKELLQHTLSGAVHMLLEILSVVAPPAFARAQRLQRCVLGLMAALKLRDDWQWPLAAVLSQIGCVSLPKETVARVEAGQTLDDEEQRLFDSHPQMAAKMLEAIPRLETIAAIVASQNGQLTQGELFADLQQASTLSAGRVLLRAAIDWDRETALGHSSATVAAALKNARPRRLPDTVIEAMASPAGHGGIRCVRLFDLTPGMVLEEALVTLRGMCLVPAGQEVTITLLARLRGLDSDIRVKEPFRVRIPP